MKCVKFVFLVGMVLLLRVVSSDTTFFEGNFDDNFIMTGNNSVDYDSVYCGNSVCDVNEDCENCMRDCGDCDVGGGGRGFVAELNETLICDYVSDFLERGGAEDEYVALKNKINSESMVKISEERLLLYLNNYDKECVVLESSTLGGVISYGDLIEKREYWPWSFLLVVVVFVVSFLIYILFFKKRRKKR